MSQEVYGQPAETATALPFHVTISEEYRKHTLLAQIMISIKREDKISSKTQVNPRVQELREARQMAALIGAEEEFMGNLAVQGEYEETLISALNFGCFKEAEELAEVAGEQLRPLDKKLSWRHGAVSNFIDSELDEEALNALEEAWEMVEKLQISLTDAERKDIILELVTTKGVAHPVPNKDVIEFAKAKGWWGDFSKDQLEHAKNIISQQMGTNSDLGGDPDPMEGWEELAGELGIDLDRDQVVAYFEGDIAEQAKKSEYPNFPTDIEKWLARADVPASQVLVQAVYEWNLTYMLPNFSYEGVSEILEVARQKGIELSHEDGFLAALREGVEFATLANWRRRDMDLAGLLSFMRERNLERTEGLNTKVIEVAAKCFAQMISLDSDKDSQYFDNKLMNAIDVAEVGISKDVPGYESSWGKIAAGALEHILSHGKIEGAKLHEFVNVFAGTWVDDLPPIEPDQAERHDPVLTNIFLKSIKARIEARDFKSAKALTDFVFSLKSAFDGACRVGDTCAEQIDREEIVSCIREFAQSLQQADGNENFVKPAIDIVASVEKATGQDLGSEGLYAAWENEVLEHPLDIGDLRAIVRSRAERAARVQPAEKSEA